MSNVKKKKKQNKEEVVKTKKEDKREVVETKNNNKKNIILWILFGLYIMLNIYLVLIHEPWRDEVHAWLMSKTYSIWDLIVESRFDGHPILWNLLLMPFAKLGAPIITLNLISLMTMVVSVYIVLFKTKLPLVIKILAIFTIPFTYTYSAMSRNYSLVILIATMITAMYEKRYEKPILYSILIALLVHTHALAWGMVAGLTFTFHIPEIVNYFRKKNKADIKKVVIGFIIICVSSILVVLELYGSTNPNYAVGASDYVNNCLNMIYMIIMSIVIVAFVRGRGYRESIIIILTLLFQVFIYKYYYSSILYQRLILIFGMTFFYVMLTCNCEKEKDDFRWMCYFVFGAFLFFGCFSMYDMMKNDIKRPYTAAQDMAKYIRENLSSEDIIYVDASVIAQTMVPYLGDIKLYDVVYDEVVTSGNRPYEYLKVIVGVNKFRKENPGKYLIISDKAMMLDDKVIYEAYDAMVNEIFTLYYIEPKEDEDGKED